MKISPFVTVQGGLQLLLFGSNDWLVGDNQGLCLKYRMWCDRFLETLIYARMSGGTKRIGLARGMNRSILISPSN